MDSRQVALATLLDAHEAYLHEARREREVVSCAIEARRQEIAEAEKSTRKTVEAVAGELTSRRRLVKELREQMSHVDGMKAEREAAARRFPALAPLAQTLEQAMLEAQAWRDQEKQALEELRNPSARLKRLREELADLQADLGLLDGLLDGLPGKGESSSSPGEVLQQEASATPEEELRAQQQVEEAKARFERRSLEHLCSVPDGDSSPGQPSVSPPPAFIDAFDLQARAIEWRLGSSDPAQSGAREAEKAELTRKADSAGVVPWALADDAFGRAAPDLELFRDWYHTAAEAARFAFCEACADPSLRHLLHAACQLVATSISALITLEQRSPKFEDRSIHEGFLALRKLLKDEWAGICHHMSHQDPADPLADLDGVRKTLQELQAKGAEKAACESSSPASRPTKPPKARSATKDEKPRTASSLVQAAREKFADDLIFGNDVEHGVGELRENAGPPRKIVRVLMALANISRGLRENERDLSLKDWLKRDCPVPVRDDAPAVKKCKRHLRARTWHDGREPRPFTLHAKVNEATSPDLCVRIYFDWCKERERIVVGWIGRHPHA